MILKNKVFLKFCTNQPKSNFLFVQIHLKSKIMNRAILLLTSLFLLTIQQTQVSYSQDEKVAHNFKITGKTKVPISPNSMAFRAVEYDPDSPDHLFISYFNKDGLITTKSQFLFKGKRFNLEDMNIYFREKELLTDGSQISYLTDGSIDKEDIIKEGRLKQRTIFYPDGKKKLLFSGDENTLNGEYQIWYPTGQLSFSGNYKNNLKEGEFQQFDSLGVLTKKGVYLEGKLISGEAVVQDIVYENPEIPAQYINGDEDFDCFLKRRSAEINGLKEMKDEKKIKLNLVVDKTGAITKIETLSVLHQPELEILNVVFKELPVFTPATVEDIPVESILKLKLIISKDGIKTNTEEKGKQIMDVFTDVEVMPQFPGGGEALRKFISSNLRYPIEAQKRGVQGKVFVNFIVNETGGVTNIKLMRGINLYLDAEAMRVVRLMPKWEPGRQDGKPVKVSYTVPINFILNNTNFNPSFPIR